MHNGKSVEMTLEEYQQTQSQKLMEIFDFATNLPVSLYAGSTVLRLPEMVYRGNRLLDSRYLFEDYLINSKKGSMDLTVSRGVSAYAGYGVRASLQQRMLQEEEYQEKGQAIKLPPYKNIKMSLSVAIRSRRSIRTMSSKVSDIVDLSTILFHGAGVTGDYRLLSEERGETDVKCLDMSEYSMVRANPSGGGLYPIHLYVVVVNTKGLEDGLYLYLPLTHSLAKIRIFSHNDLEELYSYAEFGLDIETKNINFMIFYSYSMFENARKYGDLALLFAMIEAGEISENIHLACTGMDIASCDIGGFDKAALERFMGLDGLTKHLVHLTIVGTK